MDAGLPVSLFRRLTDRHRVALDVVLAAVLAATSLPVASRDLHMASRDLQVTNPHGQAATVLSYLAVVVACLALPVRRRYPRVVFGLVALAQAVLIGLGIRLPAELAGGFAVYSLAATSATPLPYWAVAAGIAPMVTAGIVAWDGRALLAVMLAGGSVLVGWLAGENSRARHSYARALAEEAAERERERARLTAVEERSRIARELHDVVAHTMSVIAVRSGVARMTNGSQPEQAVEALSIIETISRHSLDELGRILAVLRQPEEDGAPELGPAPGLADLSDLVARTEAAGVRVDVRIDGAIRPLPDTEDLSAYRIAQEALTNVVRHSGATTATLLIRYRPDAVEIECVDSGNGTSPRAGDDDVVAGHGIVGMRERVGLYGGTFSAGPTQKGFRVLASLPVANQLQ